MNVNWSRLIGNVGRTLIGAGTIILLFVVYQLWGTAIHEQRAQNSLRSEFASALGATGLDVDEVDLAEVALPSALDERAFVPAASIDDTTEQPATGASLETVGSGATAAVIDTSFLPEGLLTGEHGPPPPPPEDGDALAEIRIPRIGVTKTIVEGVSTDQLKKGPGHYPGTPLPGQAGNASVAGHRTTYGAPFNRIDELELNDLIYVTTLQGSFVYRVSEQLIVSPSDVWVLDPSEDNRLTLTTCHPKYSARERLVVVAELIGEPAASDPSQTGGTGASELPTEEVASGADTSVPASSTTTSTTAVDVDPDDPEVAVGAPGVTSGPPAGNVSTPVADDVIRGDLDGESGSKFPALVWGLLAALTAFGVWYAAERWRKWAMYAMGAPVFLVVLFFFFEAFSALLPPGV